MCATLWKEYGVRDGPRVVRGDSRPVPQAGLIASAYDPGEELDLCTPSGGGFG